MEDLEIYKLAGEIIADITNDLNDSLYSQKQGTLVQKWSITKEFNAWAESNNSPDYAPIHTIGLNYELARQIYRDAEQFYSFAEGTLLKEKFQPYYGILKPTNPLPEIFSKEENIKFMFVGAFTWVYFHEFGHLNQEHGYIRNKFLGKMESRVQECTTNDSDHVVGAISAIYQTTELSADFEAINYCILELNRHFKDEKFKYALYTFICGISGVFYRFNSTTSNLSSLRMEGTHPHPIIRMEFALSHIFEYLDLIKGVSGLNMSREEIVHLYAHAAHSSALFWLSKNRSIQNIEKYYFMEGLFNMPEIKEYLTKIIETWDKIEPEIIKVRRFNYDHDLGLLRFSEVFRNHISDQK